MHVFRTEYQIEKMTETKNEDEEKSSQAYAAIGIGFICLLLGVPLWWKTTEVYRVHLPYSDINSLSDNPIIYQVDVEVICFDSSLTSKLVEISTELQKRLGGSSTQVLHSHYRVGVRDASAAELKFLKVVQSTKDLDSQLASVLGKENNKYYAIILPKTAAASPITPFIGRFRSLFLSAQGEDVSNIVKTVTILLRDIIVRETVVHRNLDAVQGARTLKPDKESMRSLRSTPGYDITFTLVSPQPDILNVQWDIQAGIDAYLKPFLKKLEPYADLTITSQVLHFTGLVSRPKKDSKAGEFYYTDQDLPHIITPLESKLGSHTSNNPGLNFLVYIPSRNQNPLFIRNHAGKNVPSNSFLSPRWGGIFINNFANPPQGSSLPHTVSVDMRKMMEAFVTQLRYLLNLHTQISGIDVKLAELGSEAMTEWELDSWLRGMCVENIASSTLTLQSLAQLLGQISNIVIKDDIGCEVESAVSSIKQSQKLLSEGQLKEAFLSSRAAKLASEKAFFDPSLLELLYFPEDQKFAIYIPLFLPISIPVLTSLFQAFKWFRKQKKSKLD